MYVLNNEGVQNGDHLYIPVCDESMKPFVGQVFNSEEDAFQFYKKYGYLSGFDVRRGSSKKGKYEQTIYCQEGIGSWKELAGGILVCQFNDSLACELRPMCQ